MNTIPQTIDLNPTGGCPEASVIWMHGLGADGNDFVPIVEQFKTLKPRVRFVFPHAPIRAVTVNGGAKMRAWYDITTLNVSQYEDEVGINDSAALIRLLIARERDLGIPANRIILAGFSQGAAMALHTGLRYSERLAGIIALSGYLPLSNLLIAERDLANQHTPLFMAHGLFDTVVPIMLAEASKERLAALGYTINWFSYPMVHSVSPEEIDDIYDFFNKILVVA